MRNFQCALLRGCADDGESQTLLIISALIRMTALENIQVSFSYPNIGQKT
jgi:hypothetical protein